MGRGKVTGLAGLEGEPETGEPCAALSGVSFEQWKRV